MKQIDIDELGLVSGGVDTTGLVEKSAKCPGCQKVNKVLCSEDATSVYVTCSRCRANFTFSFI